MDLTTAQEFLATQHHAVLGTVRADGSPQLSPVAAAMDDGGHIVISTRETAYKVRNIRRDPRVYLCLLPDGFFGRWLQIDGMAEVISLPDAMDPLIDCYRRIGGEHPDWDDYRAAMIRDQRVIVRILVSRIGPDKQG